MVTRRKTMEVLILILTFLFPDGSIHTRIHQAPAGETLEHCKQVVLPNALERARNTVFGIVEATGVCYIIKIDLEQV